MHAGGSVLRSYRLRGLQGVTPKLAFLHKEGRRYSLVVEMVILRLPYRQKRMELCEITLLQHVQNTKDHSTVDPRSDPARLVNVISSILERFRSRHCCARCLHGRIKLLVAVAPLKHQQIKLCIPLSQLSYLVRSLDSFFVNDPPSVTTRTDTRRPCMGAY